MIRLVYVVIISLPFVILYTCKTYYIVNHSDQYSEEERYELVLRAMELARKNGRIETKVYGLENLPKEGGYVMYPNHQGKYDVLGIMLAHEKPCTFVMDEKRASIPIAREVVALLEAAKLDKNDPKKQLKTILSVGDQVAKGKKYILFPEGGYTDNHNEICDFLPGAFKCSTRSKTPIVPVLLVDSYKAFGVNSLKKVTTQVHFLPPLNYEDYKELTTKEIADLVRSQIQEKMLEATA